MNARSDSEAISLRIPWIARLAPAAALLLGAAVLVAWAIHALEPQIALPKLRSMKCNAAVLFTLIGVVLFFCQRPYARWSRNVIRVCSGLVLIAASLTIFEFVTGRDLGIDELLQLDDTSRQLPGRMALATAISFLGLAGSTFLVTFKSRAAHRLAQSLLLVPMLISLFVVIGYFYGSSMVYLNFGQTSTTLFGAAAFVLCSIAVLFSRDDLELIAPFRTGRMGGLMAKVSFPGLILIPILFGWLLVKGEELGYVGTSSGAAIYVVVIVALFARIEWYSSKLLNEVDRQRGDAQRRENEFRETSNLDPLTSVLNRRGLWDRIEAEWNRALRCGEPLAFMLLDVDYFKQINDAYGHKIGDSVVKSVAQVLIKTCRSFDIVARYGGDEFSIVAVNADEATALKIAERIHRSLAGSTIHVGGKSIRVTASVGISQCFGENDTIEGLIDRADQALLAAKRSGRKKSICHSKLSEDDRKASQLAAEEFGSGDQAEAVAGAS
jgi:diguanylate cyclase (GGDEF)-like protein